MKSTYHKYCSLFFIVATFSCQKFVAIDAPSNAVPSDELFKTDAGAISAVTGLYSDMTKANLTLTNGGVTVYTALSSDEVTTTGVNPVFDLYRFNELTPSEPSLLNQFWAPAYRSIYTANAILEGIERSQTLSATVKNQLKGEMLFVRAFHYFYLVNLFGDVPYLTATDYQVNALKPRTPVADIYSNIVGDLRQAKDLLLEDYPSGSKGRPNKWTATALLARIYLFIHDWSNAEMMSNAIIGSGRYALCNDLHDVFSPASPEVIWFLQRDNRNTAEGTVFVPASPSAQAQYTLTDSLRLAFEPTDQRLTVWVGKQTLAGVEYYYPFKYKARGGLPVTEFLSVFRLAELLLIRAEARAQQGKVTDAWSDLNILRLRAGLTPNGANNSSALLEAIAAERRVELFAKWGHRWLDLKRTNRANSVLSLVKAPNWQPTDQLYPIPLSEIQNNPTLIQNPGY